MTEAYKKIVASQFEAVLFMMHECLAKCPPTCWEATIARYPFWETAYHALMFCDCYLSPSDESFVPDERHLPRGRAELEDEHPSKRDARQLIEYIEFCRKKAAEQIGVETAESLAGPSGFPWYKVTRAEMHVINLRHVQHHVGQLSACVRRADASLQDPKAVRWSGSGWRT